MNSSMIRYILGSVLKIEACLMLLPCLTAAIYQEDEGFYFLLVAVVTALIGFLMTSPAEKSQMFALFFWSAFC